MSRGRATVKRFALTLLGSAVILAAVGAIFAALTGRGTWQSITWTFIIGGGSVVVVSVAGSGSGRPVADRWTGMTAFGGMVPDSPSAAGWLVDGLALVGLGVAGLFA